MAKKCCDFVNCVIEYSKCIKMTANCGLQKGKKYI